MDMYTQSNTCNLIDGLKCPASVYVIDNTMES
jgi:hypothetical protein